MPSILTWSYFGLGYIALGNGLTVVSTFQQNIENGYSSLYNSSLTIITMVAAFFAIVGLIKALSWSRMLACIVVATQSILTLGASIYLSYLDSDLATFLLIQASLIGLPLLFLAYKLYSSDPLKIYLKNA